jgi:Asp-tRNA(Asn)/Glu-tRNA(Gln) amidotransferase A subunit family amidase
VGRAVEIIEAALARLRWVDIRLQAFAQGPEVAAAHSLDRQRAPGAPGALALAGVPVGVKVGGGVEWVSVRRLLVAGCIRIRAILGGGG